MNDYSAGAGFRVPDTAAVSDIERRADSAGATTIARYLRLLRRWKWVIVASVVAGVALALVVTLLSTKRYSATTTIEIAREEARIVNVDGIQPPTGPVDQEFYQTQYGLLASRALAERVARDLRLADDRAFLAMIRVDPDVGEDRPLDNSPAARATRIRKTGTALLGMVSVDPERASRLVNIVVTTADPQLSAKIANVWARLFIQMNIERKFNATSYARDFLEKRLNELRGKLDSSERELVQYAANERIVSVGGTSAGTGPGQLTTGERSLTSDDLVAYNNNLASARSQRIAAETALDTARRNAGATTTGVNNLALGNLRQERARVAADYARVTAQFTTEYPQAVALRAQIAQLDRAISTEEGRIVGSLRGEFEQARQRESELSSRVEQLKGSMLDLRRRSIQYNILQREVDTNRSLYDGLLQRYKEIGIAGGIGANNISIVDEASVPNAPSRPRPMINLILGLLAGTMIGIALSIALDQIDEKISDPSELERFLGTPSLGVVPKLDTEEPLTELEDRRSATTEAYLTIKTNLQFATPKGVPRSLLITSTRAAEGKSTTSLALALILARQGLKVVIIDGDMRSPSLHSRLSIRNEAGLSNLLSGNATWQSVVQETTLSGVKAISAGPHPPNAADLLSGPSLRRMIEDLLVEFDHVVIDAPPMLGLADAPLIASIAEGVIYVVEANGVQSRSARTAIQRLVGSGAPLLGAVLTKFVSNKANYGYGYEYGYGYGQTSQKNS
jgi:succinoglycan biosynthesis transport protein ExoP